MTELILKEEVYAIIGAAIEVHRELGSGFLNYLKATGLRVGLLINFGSVGRLEWRRLVR